MRARGFTLIEILLVLALFVMILSLVGPALVSRIAPMTFERTAEQIESVLLLAREDSRRTGAIVFVYAERDESDGVTRLVSRPKPIVGGMDRMDMEPVFNGASEGGFGAMGMEVERGDHLITLPSRYRLGHEAPGFDIEDPEMPAGFLEDPRGDPVGFDSDDSPVSPALILVCLPDGSLVLPRPTWLVDDSARAAEIRVDGAIGVVRVVAVDPPRPGDEPRGQELPEPAGAIPEGVLPEMGP